MKRLIIARNGEHSGGILNARGVTGITDLALRLKPYAGVGKGYILCSMAKPAESSALIFAWALGAEASPHAVFGRSSQGLEAACQLIEEFGNRHDFIVVVTHREYTEQLPRHYGKTILGVALDRPALDYGQAYVIDCSDKSIDRL